MEFVLGPILLVLGLIACYYFRPSIKRTSEYAEARITATVTEGHVDLIKRMNAVNEQLQGIEINTPEMMYAKITGKMEAATDKEVKQKK